MPQSTTVWWLIAATGLLLLLKCAYSCARIGPKPQGRAKVIYQRYMVLALVATFTGGGALFAISYNLVIRELSKTLPAVVFVSAMVLVSAAYYAGHRKYKRLQLAKA